VEQLLEKQKIFTTIVARLKEDDVWSGLDSNQQTEVANDIVSGNCCLQEANACLAMVSPESPETQAAIKVFGKNLWETAYETQNLFQKTGADKLLTRGNYIYYVENIIPLAIAYELQTNSEFSSALDILIERKTFSQDLSYELRVIHVIQELSSKIADLIREKIAQEHRDVLLQEKRMEDKKYTLNINDAIKEYLASIGLDIENIAIAAINRYRNAAAMG
jgi:hypothetical protein